MAQAPQQQNIQQTNMMARAAVLANAVEMIQSIYSTTIAAPASPNNVINVVPRNVGLIKNFYVEVTATVTNTATTTLTLTSFGPANLLSQVQFTDLQNNVRINTTGWHLAVVNSAKGRRPFGAAFSSDSPIFPSTNATSLIVNAASTVGVSSGSAVLQMLYKIPLAYHDNDLRGAIYANIVNATMNLQLTVNPTPFIVSSSDYTLAVYTGATVSSATLSGVKINVYQEYLDQLPMGQNGPILPILDLSTIYELKTTNLSGIVVSQDFPVPYANFRDFLSTVVIYDNAGTLNVGSDINYFAIQSANFTNIIKQDANLTIFKSRQHVQVDMPKGTYYLDHRQKPLSTIQYGNLELIVNPSSVGTNASLYVGFEDFALINSITGAGSLPGG